MAVKTIVLKGAGIQKEGKAGGAITPGHLVQKNSSDEVVVHATAAAKAAPAFARENEVVGKGIDTAYASGDNVIYEVVPPGSEIYALVAASAAALVIGDLMESAGNGTLRKVTAFSQSGTTPFAVTPAGIPVARALEALDNSAGGSPARIKVEVL